MSPACKQFMQTLCQSSALSSHGHIARQIALGMVLVALLAGAANASGSDAWAQHDQDVAEACKKASEFKQPKVRGTPIVFDDRLAVTALLVSGIYPQKHMAGKWGQVLCLYERKTKIAQVQEWPLGPK